MSNTTPNFRVVKLPPGTPPCEMVDQAIDQHAVIESGDLVCLPDLVLIEAAANGHDTPPGVMWARNDGRTAHLYRNTRTR